MNGSIILLSLCSLLFHEISRDAFGEPALVNHRAVAQIVLGGDNKLAKHESKRRTSTRRQHRRRMNSNLVEMSLKSKKEIKRAKIIFFLTNLSQSSIRSSLALDRLIEQGHVAIEAAQKTLQHQHVALRVVQISLLGVKQQKPMRREIFFLSFATSKTGWS